MDRVALKQRVNEDLTSISPWPTISFRHPAYSEPEDILSKLPRLDHTEQSSTALGPEHETVAGVHHRTALLACQIIANNAFNGYLATDRDGQDPVGVSARWDTHEGELLVHRRRGHRRRRCIFNRSEV